MSSEPWSRLQAGDRMRIGEVAERPGVATSRIRYYERIGLLPAPERVGGQRRYDLAVLRRPSAIDVAQRAGMTQGEVMVLLERRDAPMSDVRRELADAKLSEIDALSDRATSVRRWLAAARNCECQTIDACALFEGAPGRLGFTQRPPSAAACSFRGT